MKLCKSCGGEISPKAKKCKHCGSDQRSWIGRYPVLTALLLLVLVGFLFPSQNKSNTHTSKTAVVPEKTISSVELSDLFSAYSINEIFADEKYKGRWLKVTGKVNSIGKDILDKMYVVIELDERNGSLQCMLKNSQTYKASRLVKGENVTLVGRASGKLMYILFRECEIR